jgi:hypothetical protein
MDRLTWAALGIAALWIVAAPALVAMDCWWPLYAVAAATAVLAVASRWSL